MSGTMVVPWAGKELSIKRNQVTKFESTEFSSVAVAPCGPIPGPNPQTQVINLVYDGNESQSCLLERLGS